jgi:hypothetical protein
VPWRIVLAVVTVAVAVVLFFVFRPEDESETAGPSGTTSTAETTTGETTTLPAEEVPTRVEIVVRGGRPVGGVQRFAVAEGDRVVVVVRSDVADEVHVHGYDLMRDVEAGGTARIAFTADLTGTFEIELEERHSQLAEFRVEP